MPDAALGGTPHLYVEVLKCFEMQIAALCAASQFYCLTLKLCLSTGGPWNTISSYNNSRDCSPNLLKIETSSYYRFLPEYLVTEAGNAAHSHPWSRPCSLQHCSGIKVKKTSTFRKTTRCDISSAGSSVPRNGGYVNTNKTVQEIE